MRTHAISRFMWVGAAICGLSSPATSRFSGRAPESALKKPARPDQEIPATRPVVQVVLKDGKQIEGLSVPLLRRHVHNSRRRKVPLGFRARH